MRGFHQVFRNERTGKRGQQRVGVLVQAVRRKRFGQVLVRIFLAHVDGFGRDGAHIEGLLLDVLEILFVLAYVSADGNDIKAFFDLKPLKDDGGIETAGIGENDLLLFGCGGFGSHESSFLRVLWRTAISENSRRSMCGRSDASSRCAACGHAKRR